MPKKAAHVRNARVIVDLLFTPPLCQLLRGHVLLWVLVSIRNHGAEFENIDRLTAFTDSLLTEKRFAGRVNLNGNACSYNGDGQHRADHSRKYNVEGSLEGKVAWPTFPGGSSVGIGSRRPIASCRNEALRRSRVLNGERKLRSNRSLRVCPPIPNLINRCRIHGRILYIFCFIRHVLFQHFVPGPGILPILFSDRPRLGDRLFKVSQYTLFRRKHSEANARSYASAAQVELQISSALASVNGFDKAFVAQQRTCRNYDLVAVF